MSPDITKRPWGSFRSLHRIPGCQVKELCVLPGRRLSLQAHEKRSEHWVVARGPALVTLDDRKQRLETGEHIFIPRRARHRLANPGTENILIIEVQIGSYLEEDDIIRYADDYQRATEPQA